MKKLLGLSLVALGAAFSASGDCGPSASTKGQTSDVYGHTFFTVRRPFYPALPEMVSGPWRGAALRRDCGIGGAIQVVGFGGQSTNSKDLSRYFGPNGNSDFTVGLSQQGLTLADINPAHFNVGVGLTTFSSTISFRPRQTFAGVGIQYRQYLGYNDCCERKWFLDIALPVVHVKNDMRLTETVTASVGTLTTGAAANMIQGFAGTTGFIGSTGNAVRMNYGKIDGSRSNTRLQDVIVRVGYQYVCEEHCHFLGYVGIDAPAGNKPKAEYVFEPIVGNNQNVGIMTGWEAGWEIWCDCDRSLWFEFDANSTYFIRNTQRRLVDLKNRPWSRYMTTFASTADAAANVITPGANVFARKLKVHPRFEVNMTTALVYNQCGFQGEIGYNFWARQAERVTLNEPWTLGPSIAALNLASGTVANQTNRLSNIGDNNLGAGCGGVAATPTGANINLLDATGAVISSRLIQLCDLNLNSAAHPAAMSHVVYGSLGYCFDCCWPIFAGIGGSYEFTGVNTALNRWTVWGKLGLSI